MPTVIYNAVIGGVSIGLTFSKQRAETWIRQSMYKGKKEVRAVAYKEPHDVSVRVQVDG